MLVVQSRMFIDALQESEVFLQGIVDVYLVGQEIRCFYKILKFFAVLTKASNRITSFPFII
jgi:hypothetical protein